MRVLYLEDNALDADLTRRALGKHAPEIDLTTAPTIADATKLLQQVGKPFDLILSDFNLPDGNALELLNVLPGLHISLPFVVVTGHGDEELAVSALKAGADDYVVKKKDYLDHLAGILRRAQDTHRTYKHRHEKPLKVLYLEHHPTDVELTEQHINRYAPYIHLHVESNAAAGLSLLPEYQGVSEFDVIVTDLHMPGISGLDILKEIKQVRNLEIPVVIVTGQGDEELAIQALKLGADDYLVKTGNYLFNLPPLLENAFFRVQLQREEEALRTSEERFRLLAENAQDMVYRQRLSPELRYEYVSPSAERMTGYKPEAFYSNPRLGFEMVHPEDKHLLDVFIHPKAKFERTISMRWIRKDGQIIWVEQKNTPIYDENKMLIAIEGIVRDITERRLAAAAVQESELRFRSLFDDANDAILLMENSTFVDCNKMAEELYGWTKAEICGRMPWEFSPEKQADGRDSETEAKERIAAALKGKTQFFEWKHIHRNGTVFDAEVHLNRLMLPEKILLVAQVRDITAKKEMGEALLESETRLRAIVEQVPAVVYTETFDPERRVIYISPQVKTLFGYTPEEWMATPGFWVSIVHPDDLESLVENDEKLLKAGDHFKGEYRIRRKDSSYCWVSDEARLIRDEKGKLLFWQGVLTDITEKKKAAEALEKSEAKLRTIVEQVPAVIYSGAHDAALSTYFISPQLKSIFGYDPELWMDNPGYWKKLIHPDDLEKLLAEDARTKATGEPFRMEYRMKHRDGTFRWVADEAKLVRDEAGRALFWQGVLQDVTERKQAEEALQASQRSYQTLSEVSPVGIFHTDLNGETTYVNPRWCEIAGLTEKKALGYGWLQAVHPDDRKLLTTGWGSAVMGKNTSVAEYRIVRPDGTIRWVMGQASPEINAEGSIIGYVGTITDITERKQAEEELHRRTQEAEVLYQASASLTSSLDIDQVLDNLLSQLVQVVACDSVTVFLYKNEQFLAVAGRGLPFPEKVIGQHFPADNALAKAMRKTGLPQIIADVQKDRRFQSWGGADYVHGWMGIPLIVRGEFIGHLTIDSRKVNAFKEADAKLALAIANQASIAIQNAHLFEQAQQEIAERKAAEEALRKSQQETEHANHLLLTLSEAAQALQNVHTQQEVYATLQEQMNALGYSSSIFELAKDGSALRLTYAKYNPGLIHKAEKMVGLRMGDFTFRPRPGSLYDRVLMQGETVHTEDSAQVVSEVIPKKLHSLARSIADLLHLKLSTSAPLIVGEKVIGVLTINGANLSEADNPAITAFARQAAIAIQNAQLFEQKQQEITERKLAEEKVRESEELISKFIENSPIYAYIKEVTPTESRVIKASENYTEMIGIPGSQMIGKTMEELFPAEFAAKITADDWKVASEGKILKLDEDLNGRNYTTFKFPIVQGEKTLLAGYTIDITDRKQAEVKVRESEELFRKAFLTSPDSININRLEDGMYISINNGFTNIMGYTEADVLGKTSLDLNIWADPADRKKLVEGLKAEGKVDNLEAHFRAKNGEIKIGLMSAAVIDLKGVAHIISITHDISERRKAEMALRESEEKFHFLAENMADIIWILDLNFRNLYVSPSVEKVLGFTVEERMRMSPEEMITPESLSRAQEVLVSKLMAIAQGGGDKNETLTMELEYYHKDGSILWMESTVRLMVDAAGEPVGIYGVSRDITERRKAEEALRESEARYRNIIETAQEGIWSLDDQNRTTYVNARMAEMLGYTPEEMLGKEVERFLPRFEMEDFQEKMEERKKGKKGHYERCYRHKDGSDRWMTVNANPLYDAQGNYIGSLGMFADVTERRKIEMALRDSEEKYRLLLESSGVGAGYYTLNGTVLLFNHQAAEQMGGRPEDFVGKSIGELFPQAKEEYLRRIKAAAQSATATDYEDCVDLPTGKKWFLSNYSKVVDSRGTIIGVQILSHEITEQKMAEEAVKLLNATLEQRVAERTRELEDAQEKLVRQEKLAVLGQLAGGVGHELRNPLGVIKNAIYYLRMVQPDADAKIKEYLGIIDSETRSADKIITDLLDFSRIKSVDREAVAIGELVEATLQRFPPDEHIKVIKKIPEPDQKVYADPRQMVQVLGNLTVNACQAMPEGGTLTISAVVKGKEATIAVKDNGTGILPVNMAKLFEPLFTTKAKGIGLGLAVSKKLMEANSGRISVKSEVGKGSTFTLHLPVAH